MAPQGGQAPPHHDAAPAEREGMHRLLGVPVCTAVPPAHRPVERSRLGGRRATHPRQDARRRQGGLGHDLPRKG
eukprot:9558515-Alexandrium_andersonii.AAC.1